MLKPPTSVRLNREALFWVLALVVLVVLPPGSNEHFTFCVPSMLGIDVCPGCGIGQSIGYFLRGNVHESLHAHPLGAFAVIVLVARVLSLTTRHSS
ncbi:MAG: DUF2752 domain-containing protein [Bradyrhizobiaceae bacterium]|nr:DUF2752 domain-containing protein [Bradyrhizobiaceae bacterium]